MNRSSVLYNAATSGRLKLNTESNSVISSWNRRVLETKTLSNTKRHHFFPLTILFWVGANGALLFTCFSGTLSFGSGTLLETSPPFLFLNDSVGRYPVGLSNCLKLYGPLMSSASYSTLLISCRFSITVGLSSCRRLAAMLNVSSFCSCLWSAGFSFTSLNRLIPFLWYTLFWWFFIR